LDYVLGRNLRDRKIWLEKLPFLIISIIGGLITIYSEGGMSGGAKYPFYQRVIFSAYALTEYFTKCVIPINLSYIYPFPNKIGEPVPYNFWIYPVIVTAVIATLLIQFKMKTNKWIYFPLLFFIANISVSLHIFSLPRFTIVADRYVYLGSAGVFLCIAVLLRQIIIQYPRYRKLIITGAAVYIILLGAYSHERSKVWHDSDNLKKELRKIIYERLKDMQKVNESDSLKINNKNETNSGTIFLE
jgi:hypothetical protein